MNIEKFFQGTVSSTATTFTLPYAARNVIIANEGSENVTVSFSVNNVLTVGVGESKSFAGINLKTFTVAAASSSSTIEITVEYDAVFAQMEEYLPTGLSKLPSRKFEIFDDFLQQTITEADTPWAFNKGNDAQAADPVIVAAAEEGVIRLTTGNNSGTLSDDGSQIVCAVPVQADSGGLVFETRLKINTAVTTVSVNAGFTDSTSLEEPFTISGSTITAVATDAACFVYDTAQTTDQWMACSVDGDTVDEDSDLTGIAPVADTYQTLRIEVDSDGNTIRYYINGSLVRTLTITGISPSVNLYATVVANATTTTSRVVDIDYIYVAHNR
jgi:hypothetical protein